MTQIKAIHTPCKNCVFAKYENITQTDCHLGYIDAYKNLDTEILEAYDEDREFYVLNDKKCIGYRENKWFKDNNLSLEEKIAIYNEKNKLSYTAVIDLANLSLDDLEHTLKQMNCGIPPQKIIIIRHRDNDLVFTYDKIKSILDGNNISCAWRIQTMIDDSVGYGSILHYISMHAYNSRFILSVTKLSNSLSNLIQKANDIVHKDLDSFIVIANKEKSCIIYCGSSYRYSSLVSDEKMLDKEQNYLFI